MKKTVALLMAVLMCLSALVFTACTFTKEQEDTDPTAMVISLNPEIELILDENAVVVSANALNEEGNLILQGSAFVGKSEEEAVKLFISLSKENGFLVSGSTNDGENTISISYTDEDAKARYDEIQKTISSYLSEENISATLQQSAELTKNYLDEQLALALPYLTEAQTKAMTEKEKLDALAQSRKETAEMYSQELKNAYYEAKEHAYDMATFDYVIDQLDIISATVLKTAQGLYDTAYNTLESLRAATLVNADSPYQVALSSFRQAKAEFLSYKSYVAEQEASEVTQAMNLQLQNLEDVLNQAETALQSAYDLANSGLDAAKSALETAYNAVVSQITNLSTEGKDYIAEASTTATAALDQFTTEFETANQATIEAAKQSWADMHNAIQTKPTDTDQK